jgi:N-methylhydantoinase A/oxoprolinase/acetone carboxylase beta subunit
MSVALGIDTGGTYTDAVLVNHKNGKVLSTAKSLTTRQDLSVGIKKAIASALNVGKQVLSPRRISLVSLSTTLATNAIAEGHGAPVCLLLIGYDPELIDQYQFQHQLATHDVVYLKGGHDVHGNEIQALDEKTAKQTILERRQKISAFAVSGYFGAINPTHELRIRNLIEELSDLPVTCGHELSTRLDSIRRATTVALNARLIPLIQDLISKVLSSLQELSVNAPLMVVKGDGSLVRAEWAMQRPVETVLSGPAASAVGAFQLAAEKDIWAVDVGGTTTDIVALTGGRPRLNPYGANIGGWRTMVEAVDVHTVGLGGDSHVHCNSENELQIGPKRVVPLCKLASEYPQEVLSALQRLVKTKKFEQQADQFLTFGRQPRNRLSDEDEKLLNRLKKGPQSLVTLANKLFSRDPWVLKRIQYLEEIGIIQRAGFTPTDALHVLKRFQRWNMEAPMLGAELLAAKFGLPIMDFCREVIQTVSKQLAAAVITKVIEDEVGSPNWEKEPTAKLLLDRAIEEAKAERMDFQMTLHRKIVAMGAPVAAYMPHTVDILHTTLSIPPHAEVANAIGAVSGGIAQRLRIYIRPLEGWQGVRLHLPDGSKDFTDLERAVRHAKEHMTPRVESLARQAGAAQVEIRVKRQDKRAKLRGNEEIYLGTDLVFIVLGRPSMASTANRP